MIGIKDQYLFFFKLADKKDFINETDLIEFKTSEKAGNTLPTFRLEFLTTDEEIPTLLNEGNSLIVSFGKNLFDSIEAKLNIKHRLCVRQGVEKIHCLVTGTLDNQNYHTSNLLITSYQDGVQTVKDITSKHFIFDSNIINTNDKMYWIQPNISDKNFVNKVWLHTYLENSFPVTAITLDNVFRFYDIRKKVKTGFDWRLTTYISSEKDIVYDGDYGIGSKSGFVNSWSGHKRIQGISNLDSGEFSQINSEASPLLSMTDVLMRSNQVQNKYAELSFSNSNVHSKYNLAFLNNLTKLVLASTISVRISFQNQFKNIKPLDIVMWKEVSTKKNSSMDYSSGLYAVTQVDKILSNKQFLITLELSRESDNSVSGNLF